MKKSVKSSKFIPRVLIAILLSAYLIGCAPKSPEYPRLYTASELEYHPKDANGVPKGYKVVYSRTGINSVHYIKEADLDKYTAKKKAYEEYKRKKVLKEEYGE